MCPTGTPRPPTGFVAEAYSAFGRWLVALDDANDCAATTEYGAYDLVDAYWRAGHGDAEWSLPGRMVLRLPPIEDDP